MAIVFITRIWAYKPLYYMTFTVSSNNFREDQYVLYETKIKSTAAMLYVDF